MVAYTIGQTHSQEARRLMHGALLRIAGIATLIVLFALIGHCA